MLFVLLAICILALISVITYSFFPFTLSRNKEPTLFTYQLAKALVIKSKYINSWWFIGKHSTQYSETFAINENISVVLNYAYTVDELGGLWAYHYFNIEYSIYIANILTSKIKLQKYLPDSRVDDKYYSTKEYNVIHELKLEWIEDINKWSGDICNNYNKKLQKEHQDELKNKKLKLEREREQLRKL